MAYDLAKLSARADILDILALYTHIIDRRMWHRMGDCFHDDASFRFGAINGSWQQFVAAARGVIDPLRMSQHKLGQTLFAIDGDLAMTETYMVAYHRVAADAPADAVFPGDGTERDIVIAGRYIDRFERRGGVWKIASRTGLTDWRQDAPSMDAGLYGLPADWRGGIGEADPAHAVCRLRDSLGGV